MSQNALFVHVLRIFLFSLCNGASLSVWKFSVCIMLVSAVNVVARRNSRNFYFFGFVDLFTTSALFERPLPWTGRPK